VDLVEGPKRTGRQLPAEDPVPVLRDVPVEVAGLRPGEAPGERGLPDLARTGDEDHLALKVLLHLRGEIARPVSHTGRMPVI